MTAGPQHSIHLTQSSEIVVHVFHHVERRHEIERVVAVRQFFARALLHVVQAACAAKSERVFRNVHAFGVAILGQHQQVRACAATNVENARPPVRHTPADLLDKTGEDAATTDVPPVRLLYLVENRVGVLHHLARQRARHSVNLLTNLRHSCLSVAFHLSVQNHANCFCCDPQNVDISRRFSETRIY